MASTVSGLLTEKGHQIWSVEPETVVFEAIRLMTEKGIGAVIVCEGDRLAGIMTERDYMRKVILEGRSSKDTPVRDIMTKQVVCIPPDITVEECMALMTERRIRHLPVLRHGKLNGIVSIGDVVKAVIANKHVMIDQLERYIMGH